MSEKQFEDELFAEMDKLQAENARLKAKERKRQKWIEKDEKLLNKPRMGRLVTVNDIQDPAFMKKYPNARIGDEFNDPEPLLWKVGLKKRPVIEQTHAQIAAQFARDFKDQIEDGTEEFLDEFDESDTEFTEAELNAFLQESARQEIKAQALSPPAKQSGKAATGGEATDKPPAPSSGSSQSEE